MPPRHRLLAALLLTLPLPSLAQERTLAWDEIVVTARLDERGTLHVRERQTIVFNGDWNSAERSFTQRLNQDLELKRIARLENGREIPLVEGDTDAVDHYDWEGGAVRWRSRLPSDPPFEETWITYVLDYTSVKGKAIDELSSLPVSNLRAWVAKLSLDNRLSSWATRWWSSSTTSTSSRPRTG